MLNHIKNGIFKAFSYYLILRKCQNQKHSRQKYSDKSQTNIYTSTKVLQN